MPFALCIPFLTIGVENLESPLTPPSNKERLKINLICYKNGVGLNRDIDVLLTELTNLGHFVQFVDSNDFTPKPKADINVFVDVVQEFFFPFAENNYFIPNPEWCFLSTDKISQFDRILCKTRDAERIFRQLNSNVIYMGFTCKDQLDENIPKNYKFALHLAGASIQKGTDTLAKVWVENPQFPTLFLIRHKNHSYDPEAANLHIINKYLSDSALKIFQNSCGLHICPSQSEGFGHYIMEALSCGAVVVTTDAPPMNEFVLDERCLAGYHRTEPWRWGVNYFVDPLKLDIAIATVLNLSENELREIGRKNREFYLENDRLFKQRLAEIFASKPSSRSKDLTESVFTNIYQNKLWGESPSGEGSKPENTKVYCLFLQNFLKNYQIQNVVDIGCGDWQISQLIDWTGIQYTGFDVFKEIIEKHQAQFSTPSIQFIHGNALKMDLPKADLLICKDVLQHLPNQDIESLLPQLKKFKHCLLVNDVDPVSLTSQNEDTPVGGYRHVDLTKPPFNLSGQKILTFISGDVTKQILYIKNNEYTR